MSRTIDTPVLHSRWLPAGREGSSETARQASRVAELRATEALRRATEALRRVDDYSRRSG